MIRLFLAKLITPKTYLVVPKEPTKDMLDVEFYGDLGSGFDAVHKWLRADEYWFPDRKDALKFGTSLYKAMINAS